MRFTMFVDERTDSSDKGLKVTLRLASQNSKYAVTLWLDATANPDVQNLQVGDQVIVEIGKAVDVSEVALTIEEAESRATAEVF